MVLPHGGERFEHHRIAGAAVGDLRDLERPAHGVAAPAVAPHAQARPPVALEGRSHGVLVAPDGQRRSVAGDEQHVEPVLRVPERHLHALRPAVGERRRHLTAAARDVVVSDDVVIDLAVEEDAIRVGRRRVGRRFGERHGARQGDDRQHLPTEPAHRGGS
jgi:hypothetical protein